jgi:Methyltransferase domain
MRSLSGWLALREEADRAARSLSLTQKIAGEVVHRTSIRIVDLGAGTGSNVRYLTRHLSSPQSWLLVDRDPELLAEARSRTAGAGHVETCELDLGKLDSPAIFSGCHLLTASALLDLVSEAWLHSLAEHCRTSGAAALFALTYDGRSHSWPPEPEDDTIRALMNEHQKQNDKGFGKAAGPDATACAARAFAAAGYHVQCEASDWILESDSGELQRELIEGWAVAAREIAPDRSSMIGGWASRRLAHLDEGHSRITVGHQDLIAWLPGEFTEPARGHRG